MASNKIGLGLIRSPILKNSLGLYNAKASAIAKVVKPNVPVIFRCISTTEKSKDTIILKPTLKNESLVYREDELTIDGFSKDNPPNWASWGACNESITADRTMVHIYFFISFTWTMVGIVYLFMYMPDHKLHDWSRREAFLELRRREEAGGDLISPDLVPRERIVLPTDEEIEELDNIEVMV